MTTIDLVYFNAGGGHRAAAQALQSVIREQRRPWRVRLVNLFEVLDPRGHFQRVTGVAPEALYNKRIEMGWSIGLSRELRLMQFMNRMGGASLQRRLASHWSRTTPDLVVSLVPNFNRVLYESLCEACPEVPFVTVMTDMADLPPNFWIEPSQKQHIVCGTAKALEQARAAGYAERHLHVASGMIIRPDFYQPLQSDPRADRRRLGLPDRAPVGLVMFGAGGSTLMRGIAGRLRKQPLILMCGHNVALAKSLRMTSAGPHHVVVDFTHDVRQYMAMADYFIGKPGPGCLSEAIQQGLPVITVRNAFTLPQERYNARWIHEHELGLVCPSWRMVNLAVDAMTADLRAYRYRAARVNNRAVFEVPEVFAELLRTSPCAQREDWSPTRPGVRCMNESATTVMA